MLKIIIIILFILFYFVFVFNLPKLIFYFFYLQMSSGKNFAKVAKLVFGGSWASGLFSCPNNL